MITFSAQVDRAACCRLDCIVRHFVFIEFNSYFNLSFNLLV